MAQHKLDSGEIIEVVEMPEQCRWENYTHQASVFVYNDWHHAVGIDEEDAVKRLQRFVLSRKPSTTR